MDSNEEYLDQLLRSLTQKEDPVSTAEPDMVSLPEDLSADIPEDLVYDEPEANSVPGKEEPEAAGSQSIDDLLKTISGETDQEETKEASPPEQGSGETSAPDLDAALSMSQSEIEQLLAANKSTPKKEEPLFSDVEQDALSSFMADLGEDSSEEVQEISDLLNKADHDEPVDDALTALLQGLKEEEPQDKTYSAEDLFGAEEAKQQPEKPGRRRKRERVKKEKKPRRSRKGKEAPEEAVPTSAEPVKAEKKSGLWKKLLDALTEEDEEEVKPVSDENGAILQQMEQEDQAKAGGTDKKAAKKADKKSVKKEDKKKKGKGDKAAGSGEDGAEESSKGKKKREKKQGKEKKQRNLLIVYQEAPGRKLSMKKVLPILAAALVVTVAYVIISQLYVGYVNRQKATDAFYAGDYLECYELLYGQDLNGSQAVMFHKSELLLKMELAKKNYQTLLLEGKDLAALDYLVQFLSRYEEYRQEGQEWNSLDVVDETYEGMTGLLTANYGLTQAQAMEIAALEEDTDYTLALMAVLEGAYGQEAAAEEEPGELFSAYEDLLPEELEDQDTVFVDTIR